MEVEILRTNYLNKDFQSLVSKLDADLAVRDGDEHDFYHQFNSIEGLHHVVVCLVNNSAVGCGALKELEPNIMEVKRMYTLPETRGKGIATKVLRELEVWAKECGNHKCILETGKKQPEAIQLYLRNGYEIVSNYGQYKGVENSVCFEKPL